MCQRMYVYQWSCTVHCTSIALYVLDSAKIISVCISIKKKLAYSTIFLYLCIDMYIYPFRFCMVLVWFWFGFKPYQNYTKTILYQNQTKTITQICIFWFGFGLVFEAEPASKKIQNQTKIYEFVVWFWLVLVTYIHT